VMKTRQTKSASQIILNKKSLDEIKQITREIDDAQEAIRSRVKMLDELKIQLPAKTTELAQTQTKFVAFGKENIDDIEPDSLDELAQLGRIIKTSAEKLSIGRPEYLAIEKGLESAKNDLNNWHNDRRAEIAEIRALRVDVPSLADRISEIKDELKTLVSNNYSDISPSNQTISLNLPNLGEKPTRAEYKQAKKTLESNLSEARNKLNQARQNIQDAQNRRQEAERAKLAAVQEERENQARLLSAQISATNAQRRKSEQEQSNKPTHTIGELKSAKPTHTSGEL
jgi:chromosome segregation ATPase